MVVRVRGRAATISAAVCLMALLVAVPSAQAAVTGSNITSPSDVTYLMYDYNNPNTFAVSGTTNGTTGDHVDVVCFSGDLARVVASSVAVNADGSFSTPSAAAHDAVNENVCKLKAVPAGTTPVDLSPFSGPRLLVGERAKSHINGGPNDGKLYDYYLYFQQLSGGMDYDSLGGCGIDDGYLIDSNDSWSTITWYCNAFLQASSGNRSEIRVDGKNAYTPNTAKNINAAATSGFPALMSYSYRLNSHTGNAVIHERDPIVKCPIATYPPSAGTCPKFVPTGVTDTRTITQDHSGRVAWITDVFTSTDGSAHKIDLLWENYERFHRTPGDSTQIEYKFPGQGSYFMHATDDSFSLPATGPGTILIRVHGSPDGDASTGRGAIVYDRPASKATFNYVGVGDAGFTLHQKAAIPAHGSVRFRFAYVQGFKGAPVASVAHQATTIFKGCTVPDLRGKSLAAAKKAIKRAHCTVGRISHAGSSIIAAGHVIGSKPKAKTHVDYGTKVALRVSTG